MWSVAIEYDPAFTIGRPEMLFDQPYATTQHLPTGVPANYDVASDGRFLMMQDRGVDFQEIRIILNARAELERLAPTQ